MSKKLTYEYVKNFIEKEGYTLLSNSYKGKEEKLSMKCDKGHEFYMSFGHFRGGSRCRECSYIKRGNKCRNRWKDGYYNNQYYTYNDVKSIIEVDGYILLSNSYSRSKDKLEVMCPKGHIYKVCVTTFKLGSRCPICNKDKITSKGEKELSQFIRSLGINIIENDRTQVINPITKHNLELDIWIPSMSKAIEYNGIYWHSLSNTDKIKQDQCKQLGIDLLIISDVMWNNNKEIEMKRIENWLLE